MSFFFSPSIAACLDIPSEWRSEWNVGWMFFCAPDSLLSKRCGFLLLKVDFIHFFLSREKKRCSDSLIQVWRLNALFVWPWFLQYYFVILVGDRHLGSKESHKKKPNRRCQGSSISRFFVFFPWKMKWWDSHTVDMAGDQMNAASPIQVNFTQRKTVSMSCFFEECHPNHSLFFSICLE